MARTAPLVHLIDGPVYVFRAYYALPPMAAPDGTPTNAAYGYASSLLKYLADFEPSHAAVAFDHAMKSFRNEIFPAYKAQRDEPPADLEPTAHSTAAAGGPCRWMGVFGAAAGLNRHGLRVSAASFVPIIYELIECRAERNLCPPTQTAVAEFTDADP